MANDSNHDRDRGYEIVGMRINVYHLLPYFLDPIATEADICSSFGLTPQQVAAARAYVLAHAETVLAQHRKIEERIAVGNPPELVEQAKRTHELFVKFKHWLETRRDNQASAEADVRHPKESSGFTTALPTFREWLTEQESRPIEGP
jgi:uncharacterized protein (DUF433 family)